MGQIEKNCYVFSIQMKILMITLVTIIVILGL